MPKVQSFDGLDALSRAAAGDLATIVHDAVRDRGGCSIALSGGSTPKRLFQLLAADGRDALPWDRIDLWWGDERAVPPDHPDSNYNMTRQALIEPLGLDPARVHRMRGEASDLSVAARDYEDELVRALGSPPVFDYVMLGMGPDGHTASLFPGSPALAETRRFVVANPVSSPLTKGAATRITMSPPALNAGRHVRFLAAGADKAAPLKHVLEGPKDPKYPAQLIAPSSGDLVWFVDHAAAALLTGGRS
ncbi:MAG: pgl [Deltaproteobacteria bacterium]|nr:pgl [Deltaproteobacteria bacterium]